MMRRRDLPMANTPLVFQRFARINMGVTTLISARRDHLRARSVRRIRRERVSHHGVKKRLLRTFVAVSRAKNGRFWRYQSCNEVARPKRFELLTRQTWNGSDDEK
jgi:hypothetical protein